MGGLERKPVALADVQVRIICRTMPVEIAEVEQTSSHVGMFGFKRSSIEPLGTSQG